MNFLKQHFYIDAGIILPATVNSTDDHHRVRTAIEDKSPQAQRHTDNTKTSDIFRTDDIKTHIDLIENITPNMTDDVKVNLRRIVKNPLSKTQLSDNGNSKSYAFAKNKKRHSTAFASSYLVDRKGGKALEKRRSLNIVSSRELSRIPVCVKNRESVSTITHHRPDGPENTTIVTKSVSKKSVPLHSRNNNSTIAVQSNLSDESSTLSPTSDINVPVKSSNLPVAIRLVNVKSAIDTNTITLPI